MPRPAQPNPRQKAKKPLIFIRTDDGLMVEALAVESIASTEEARPPGISLEGMTILDADTAQALLDPPPEPTDALSAILALR